ncbi:MAG: cupin domain-containing protein [Spirochaetes bacterium]|nr:cupin domain-containing protein [Spirochaetota bacterium]
MPSPRSPEALIRLLGLMPHPEGGFYRETYRSGGILPRAQLPPGFSGDAPFSTAIYFLLTKDAFSSFHRIRSDELWHFYSGDPLEVHLLSPGTGHRLLELGPELERGQAFQGCVEAGAWFGARVRPGGAWSLVGCTVAPGFRFEDFELARREALARQFPDQRNLVHDLTRSEAAR